MRKYIKLEEPEQIAFIDWCNLHPKLRDYVIHIPNERLATKSYYFKLKRMGVKAGVSDIFIPIPQYPWHGLWIEMKANKKSTISDNQLKWLKMMEFQGYKSEICFGCDEAIKITRDYFINSDIV